MSTENQIKSTDWLTRGISKEQLEREKREAIFSSDLQGCIEYDEWSAREYGVESIDFDATAEKMVAKGYRKQEWISVEVVRCKDCLYSEEVQGVLGVCLYCSYWSKDTDDNTFCSNGVKMKGVDNEQREAER